MGELVEPNLVGQFLHNAGVESLVKNIKQHVFRGVIDHLHQNVKPELPTHYSGSCKNFVAAVRKSIQSTPDNFPYALRYPHLP